MQEMLEMKKLAEQFIKKADQFIKEQKAKQSKNV